MAPCQGHAAPPQDGSPQGLEAEGGGDNSERMTRWGAVAVPAPAPSILHTSLPLNRPAALGHPTRLTPFHR